jgi:RND family efflux transporter MFP subunit
LKTSDEPYVKQLDASVQPARKRPGVRPLLTFFAVIAVLIAAGIVAGLLPKLRREQALHATGQTEISQRPVVNVASAKLASPKSTLDLPGDIQALIESPVFPRVDGYMSKRNVDIGDIVKTGQIMAEIETPELDQQLLQARATVSNSESILKELEANIVLAEANSRLAETTCERWKVLQGKGAIARQDFDEKDADYQVKKATVEAAKARLMSARDTVSANESNVRRLEQMKSFARVTAPFDGIVTYRVMDVGTLVNAGNGGANHEMFRVADLDTMRIFVNVPQTWVGAIHDEQKAEVRVQELPGKIFVALVAHSTHEVDMSSRSMLAVLRTPNPNHLLLPGMYAQVRFATSRPVSTLMIPTDAMVNGTQGTRVATSGPDGKVHFKSVRVGNDFGNEVEILDGLSPDDLVIMNPTDAIREGVEIEVKKGAR